MGKKPNLNDLSRRERQIMDVVYMLGKATAVDVMDGIPDPPSNASVRKLLTILEEKGHLRHEMDGNRFVYYPTVSTEKAKKTAIKHLVETFFKGSAANAVVALLDQSEKDLSVDEREVIAELINKSKQEGR